MKDKINKIILVLKKDGLLKTLEKIYKYIKANYISKINFFSYLYIKINYKKFKHEINNILNSNYDRIIVWRSSFGWNVPLFQRPQHIAKNLAKKNCLIFYETTTVTDKVKTFKKIDNNLFLVNFNNTAMKKLINNSLKNIKKPKYIQFYSTDCTVSITELKEYITNNFKVIYEYIDDINPKLIGTINLPANLQDKYNYMLKDKENVFVIVTAEALKEDVESKRGKEKLAFSCNGVDYNHFKNINKNFIFDRPFSDVLNNSNPIIGYYGALASWFDYDLIKYLALQKPNYNIVLIGIKYDDSFDKSNLSDYPNIYFLGPKDYNILQNYASNFDVCTIPFLINSITEATSPIKLFEYMALGKPIVTTAMKECKKYSSVMIANNKEEFVNLIDKSLLINKNQTEDYFKLLNKEALENTWEAKADIIINLLKKYEV